MPSLEGASASLRPRVFEEVDGNHRERRTRKPGEKRAEKGWGRVEGPRLSPGWPRLWAVVVKGPWNTLFTLLCHLQIEHLSLRKCHKE